MENSSTTKICSTCKTEKPTEDFQKSGGAKKDGSPKLRSSCKSCCKESDRQRYRNNPDRQRYVREYGDKYRLAIQELKRRYFAFGCVDCGITDIRVLEFDHLSDKSFNIAGNRRSLTLIESEIQKCEVVCANCHAIRTCERSSNWRSRE